MLVSRISSRFPRAIVTQCRSSLLLCSRQQQQQQHVPILASQCHEKVTLFHESVLQRFGISSSASPQHNEKETSQSQSKPGSTKENGEMNGNCEASVSADSQGQDENDESGSDLASNDNTNENIKQRRRHTKQAVSSDSDSDSDLDTEDLSKDDLMKLVAEKEELLKIKDDEFQKMKEKVLRSYAEMENVMNRAKREAENSKKFAIQNFVKALLDVADNMGRASSVVKESFSKIDESKDTVGAVPLLKTLLEGVEMTDKQLAEGSG
ncbi:grpE protein homolog 2, mitochondrial-like isoform X4 [Solanum dulcamara]|uniref:grpE protein homolog 2, mitochondrial-like isoform X4 n=1 Tax=Solanum dulcamara TaxID=45834 RepID=UPI002485E9F0|nr:grpE protein homolog 2, mitochondrial-like isoform X4 [Solanum dulcamara]